jgi:hypothetical protein
MGLLVAAGGRAMRKEKTMSLSRTAFFVFCGTLIFALTLTSCKDEKKPVQQYGDTLVHGYQSAQKVQKDANLQQVQRRVHEFRATNERYPVDLKELEEFTKSPIDENKYDYDPATGSITAK